ncbi:MAG TPA: 3-methyl-2-oxobutanoate hydroxymethyltransferase [Verrucomicrobiota bacterium]|nr:3-methyl-2-oxobutanoate hydroxymethyltransferase [Verrucomicrobiota bacterium]
MTKVTPESIRQMKGRKRIAALTAYDYPTAKLLSEIGIDIILVGDSLGMVVLGYPDTTSVTMADMEHHTRAAARAMPRSLLAADLPSGSCNTPETAVANANRLIAAVAETVKAEGGLAIAEQIKAIRNAGIPFLGHIGMLPQTIHQEKRYRIKGRSQEEKQALIADAQFLADVGAFAVVLELVDPPVAAEITKHIPIPTIGIGSGQECDGQILVFNDLVGTFPWFRPRFVKPRLEAFALMREAIMAWRASL